MPAQSRRKCNFPFPPEKQREYSFWKETVEFERVRIALRMMVHEETDFKISLYTGMSFKKIKYIRENLLEREKESIRRKSEMMEKSLRMQDPKGVYRPWA